MSNCLITTLEDKLIVLCLIRSRHYCGSIAGCFHVHIHRLHANRLLQVELKYSRNFESAFNGFFHYYVKRKILFYLYCVYFQRNGKSLSAIHSISVHSRSEFSVIAYVLYVQC